jgi:hypothetical protein
LVEPSIQLADETSELVMHRFLVPRLVELCVLGSQVGHLGQLSRQAVDPVIERSQATMHDGTIVLATAEALLAVLVIV